MKTLKFEEMEKIEGGKPAWCAEAWGRCLVNSPGKAIPFWNLGIVAGCSIGFLGCGNE